MTTLAPRLRLTVPNLPASDLLIPLERCIRWLGRSAACLLAGRDGGEKPPAAPGQAAQFHYFTLEHKP